MSIPGNLWRMVITLQTQLLGGGNIGGDPRLVDDKQTALMTKLIEAQIALTEKGWRCWRRGDGDSDGWRGNTMKY